MLPERSNIIWRQFTTSPSVSAIFPLALKCSRAQISSRNKCTQFTLKFVFLNHSFRARSGVHCHQAPLRMRPRAVTYELEGRPVRKGGKVQRNLRGEEIVSCLRCYFCLSLSGCPSLNVGYSSVSPARYRHQISLL